jgi:hypothetical protein
MAPFDVPPEIVDDGGARLADALLRLYFTGGSTDDLPVQSQHLRLEILDRDGRRGDGESAVSIAIGDQLNLFVVNHFPFPVAGGVPSVGWVSFPDVSSR